MLNFQNSKYLGYFMTSLTPINIHNTNKYPQNATKSTEIGIEDRQMMYFIWACVWEEKYDVDGDVKISKCSKFGVFYDVIDARKYHKMRPNALKLTVK